jgi:clan AA aspartic protease (TIGR02281 family)
MKMALLAALAAGLALAYPAHAGITCNLTDQKGNALQYSFARGGHGFSNEIVVKRNGAVISKGGPMWTRTYNSSQRTMTLEQAGWSLVYEAKPNDTDISQAALFAPSATQKATGTCVADYSLDAPQQPAPTVEASTPAPPSYTAQAPSTGGPDAVGIITLGGKGAADQVQLGSTEVPMLIDTGATSILVNPSIAATLVNAGEATWGDATMTEVADGSKVPTRNLTIRQLRIGKHVLYNVPAMVNATDTEMLLGFPVLNQMGRFTIDTTSHLLTFG